MPAGRALAEYLVIQGIATGLYQDLWLNEYPDEPDELAVLYTYGGLPDTHVVGTTTPDTERPRIQLYERGVVSEVVEARIISKSLVLAAIADQVIDGSRYTRVTRVQSPFLLGRDKKRRFEWVCNLQIEKEPG